MDVVVAGGHGQIGLRLLGLLAADGHRARGLIRKPEQAADLEAAGAEPVIADLERLDDLAPHVQGADAIVFAAGAGAGSGQERKRTLDLGGAVKLIAAAKAAGVARYVIVSSVGADDPEGGSDEMRPYLRAKAEADAAVRGSGLAFTIVRPGRLTDDPGTGRVAAGADVQRADVPRDDVAATLLAVLSEPGTIGATFVLVGGETPIDDALAAL